MQGMRVALLVVLCALPLTALAKGDQATCGAKCADKLSSCTKGCKEQKCISRCAERTQTCQSACSAAAPAKLIRGEDGTTGNEKAAREPPKGKFPTARPPH
jgi:hypothetical protein